MATVTGATDASVRTDATLRIVSRVRLRAQRRAAWLRTLADHEADGDGLRAMSADGWLGSWDDEDLERQWFATDLARPMGEAIEALEAEHARDGASRLAWLERIFGLDSRESDLVQACLAAALDPSLARVFAHLHASPARGYPTEGLVARLYGHGLHRVLTPESPLLRWAIVHEEAVGPGEPKALSLDLLVRDWLVGDNRLDSVLVGLARLHRPLPPLPRWPVDELAETIRRLAAPPDARAGRGVRVRLIGPPGSGRRSLAACVAERLRMPLLVVDSDLVSDEEWSGLFLRAQRQAYLDGCALAWVGDRALRRRWPVPPRPFPVQMVVTEAGEVPEPVPGVIDHAFEMPAPSVAERAALWKTYVRSATEWPEAELLALAGQHRVTPGEIAAIGEGRARSAADAALLVRELTRHRLGDLARWVECPFTWDDLVVPDAIRRGLQDLVFEATDRAAFWEGAAARRLFPEGRGLFALFTGTPGTGKTMAAQVIAGRLRLDLFRISLSTVVSKYVGETSKNLQRILSRAEAMDAVLLFDEADALFGKRTDIKDAHDRFANTDTNYLLQAIEAYRGIAILATNKKGNIDPAFTRRLRYVLEFPRPDTAQRRTLWERLVGELAGAERLRELGYAIDALAASIEATGAQIKYAVLGGLFAARQDGRPLSAAHLLRGLERELLKEGRALNERERERLTGHGG